MRWHYQWIVVNEFLPAIAGEELVEDILRRGRRFYRWRNAPFIPVEFSVAAYRYGHSQVRPGYIANFSGDEGRPFLAHLFRADVDHSLPDPDDLVGGKRAPRRFVDWRTFFDLGPTRQGMRTSVHRPSPTSGSTQSCPRSCSTCPDSPADPARSPSATYSADSHSSWHPGSGSRAR